MLRVYDLSVSCACHALVLGVMVGGLCVHQCVRQVSMDCSTYTGTVTLGA